MLGWKWYGNLYSERGYCSTVNDQNVVISVLFKSI
jgi:hypothetical protein